MYNANSSTDGPTTSRQSSAMYRGGNPRKLSDYCNIFAEKTNRIGRNVESFMQCRGCFAASHPADDPSRGNAIARRSNGDVIRNDYRPTDRLDERVQPREENHYRYGRPERTSRERPSTYPYAKPVYPRERVTDANYADRDTTESPPRRIRQRDYTDLYEDRSGWKDPTDSNGSKPILRNGISHARGERLYSSTLPRRSRTINFRDRSSNSLEYRRGYPKSLQDLSDLELDDRIRDPNTGLFFSANDVDWRNDGSLDDGYRRRRYREDQLEDNYLRLYRSLSRLNKYPQGGKYEPGQVHYERECRTFGKDTVAFIYYKTCYL